MGLIRILLAVSVLIFHSDSVLGLSMLGGGLAVQAFFMISGFYMALVLDGKYKASLRGGGYRLFITNRLYKLYPAYWLICILILLTAVVTYLIKGTFFTLAPWLEYWDSMGFKAILLLAISNFSLLLQEVLWAIGIDLETVGFYLSPSVTLIPAQERASNFLLVGPAWSISLEIMFYLIAPFLVKRKNYILIMLIILSWSLRNLLPHWSLGYDPWVYRFFPSNLCFFLLGIIAYRLYKFCEKRYRATAGQQILLKAIYLANILFILFFANIPAVIIDKDLLFLTFFFLSMPLIFLLSKGWKQDRSIGELSYPIYISHMYIFMISKHLISGLGISEHWHGELCLVFTLLLSLLMHKVLLKRIEQYRQRRVKLAQ